MSRQSLIAAFLARHGYGAARTEPLAQDASLRRYLRLTGGPRPAVLMDAPPPEDIRPFVRIAGHLAAIGVSVPEIFAADEAAGLLLEEDLGDGPSGDAPPPVAEGGWGERPIPPTTPDAGGRVPRCSGAVRIAPSARR
jgi:aminoglycoside/choline kinase family phosphotransferase